MSGSFPRPRNPYGWLLLLLGGLAAGGMLAILVSGMGSRVRPNLGFFIPGLIILTLAVIFGIGVF